MTTPQDVKSLRKRSLVASLFGSALAGMISLTPIAYAQDATPPATPEASPEASPEATPEAPAADQVPAEITNLLTSELAEFPEAPISVRLLQMTIAPGTVNPAHYHPGPEFDYVLSGTLTVAAEGEASMTRDGEAEAIPEDGAELTAGQWAVYPPESVMTLSNEGDEDVVILAAVFQPSAEDIDTSVYPDFPDGEDPPASDFEGISYEVLGDGLISDFPGGGTTVILDDVTVPAGTDLPATDGATLYSLVEGNLSFTVDDGAVQVSRNASQGIRPNAAPGQEFTLEAMDGAFFPVGVTATSRADEDEPVRFFRLTAVPSDALTGTPATLTYLQSGVAAGEDGDGGDGTDAASTEIEVGATVTTNTDNVNLRAEPSADADVVDQLAADVELEVIGGPEEADDYTWWNVRVLSSDAEGWVVEDFIGAGSPEEETPEAEDGDATPEADGATPEAEAGDDDEFAEGDAVVTNDDNVRMREDSTTGSDIVEVYSAETEFVVTGEPEENEGTVWVPVENEDDGNTGWIAADFLDPAP